MTASDLRLELAALLKAAAEKAAKHCAAARAEWSTFSQAHADGNGDVPPEAEGPYVEWLLSRMQVDRVLDRYARLFSADEDYR